MALKMKKACEKCGRELSGDDDVYICSHECTFCGRLFGRAEIDLSKLRR
jgi:hypothetical protein